MEMARDRPFPERTPPETGALDAVAILVFGGLGGTLRRMLRRFRPAGEGIVAAVSRHSVGLAGLSNAEIAARGRGLRVTLRRDGFAIGPVAACFALVDEAAWRTLGQRYYPSQLIAGWAMLRGHLAEMATGEGKTFAATLPACAAALAGYPVHIVTVNDYLARRDAETMRALYGLFGVQVSAVEQSMDRAARQAAYAANVTYCTNKDLVFDYLRDRIVAEGRAGRLQRELAALAVGAKRPSTLVLRGLYFAIIDEADSILIDEARTPLILSGQSDGLGVDAVNLAALEVARTLSPGIDFQLDPGGGGAVLLQSGRLRVGDDVRLGATRRAREEIGQQAITALHVLRRDVHYIVAEGEVRIVDEPTGRVMPDRAWEKGLHQLVEAKEGCMASGRRRTLARISYQRFFQRYLILAGMTGTAREAAGELRRTYGLDTIRVALHRRDRRKVLPPLICRNEAEKLSAIGDEVERVVGAGNRPVLIGTRSVAASEAVSRVLAARGTVHALLNARNPEAEAVIIAEAGHAGRVTVATNMAGRGTDIRLGPGVEVKGGLHVILTEFHESSRIDRQLFGRCARPGDRGSCRAIVALDDELYLRHAPRLTDLLRRLWPLGAMARRRLLVALNYFAQRAAGQLAHSARMETLAFNRDLERLLGFAGRGE